MSLLRELDRRTRVAAGSPPLDRSRGRRCLHDGLRSFSPALPTRSKSDWRSIARPEQLAAAWDWSTWLILAGRGAGKTRAGAEWIRGLAEAATRVSHRVGRANRGGRPRYHGRR